MLRLGPSAIGLDARDLTWHQDRQNKRMVARREKLQQPSRAPQPDSLTTESWSSDGVESRSENDLNDDLHGDEKIVSQQPVPRDSRAFWDNVIQAAGALTESQDDPHLDAENMEMLRMSIERKSSPTSSANVVYEDESDNDRTDERPLARSSTVVRRKDLRKHYGILIDESEPKAATGRHREAVTFGEADQQYRDQSLDSSTWQPDVHMYESTYRRGNSGYGLGGDESVTAVDSRRTDSDRNNTSERHSRLSTEIMAQQTPTYDNGAATRGIWERQNPRSGLLSHPPRRRARGTRRLHSRLFGTSDLSSTSRSVPQYDGLGASPASIGEQFSQINLRGTREGPLFPDAESQSISDRVHGMSTDGNVERPDSPAYATHTSPRNQQLYSAEAARLSRYSSLSSLSNGHAHQTSPLSPLSFGPSSPHADDPGAPYTAISLPPPFSSTTRNVSIGSAAPTFGQSPYSPQTPSPSRSHSSSLRATAPMFPPQSSTGHISQGHNNTPATPSPSSRPPTRNPHHPGAPLTVYNDSVSPSTQPQTPADLQHSRHAGRSSAVINPVSAPPRLNTRPSRGLSWTQPAAFAVRERHGQRDTSPTRIGGRRFSPAPSARVPPRRSGEGGSPGRQSRRGEILEGLRSGLGLGSGRSRQSMARRNEMMENQGRVTQQEREWRRNRIGGRGV